MSRPEASELADLELELRLLPGVVDVGAPSVETPITVVTVGPEPTLVEAATRIARMHSVEQPLSVVDLSRTGDDGTGSGGRVVLLRTGFDPGTGTVRVELAHDQRHSSGGAASGPVVGAVEATLAALADLGIEVPFYLMGVGPPGSMVAAGSDPVIMVVLRPFEASAGSGDRIGVARGTTEAEAAARATLGALNRFLALSKVQRTVPAR